MTSFHVTSAHATKLDDFLDRNAIQKKIRDTIADQDINFSADLGNIDLIKGVNLSNKYKYDVEASYISQYYTRIDKWDIKLAINVGDVLKDLIDVPFSFGVERENSFFFVRQFPTKKEAIKALPYAPNKLPLNAKMALKLNNGDFVSMPANLNIASSLSATTATELPIVLSGEAKAFYIVSGEFTIQVFKLDNTHVRLKLITKRGMSTGASLSAGVSFKFFGISILDHQIDRILERDLVQLGASYDPSAQFIVDYIFDLTSPEAQESYNNVLSSTFKFKDIVVTDQMLSAQDLKDKVISSYEKADEIFEADKNLEPKLRRVQRIFKGFNNDKARASHLKLSLLLAKYAKERTFTESKVTFIDKNEKNLQFYYPTFSKYIETSLGKSIFELKDQNFQNNFGLIPKFDTENVDLKNPDIGLTFERKDRYFTAYEQKAVEKFMVGQIPTEMAKGIDLTQWRDGKRKQDSRIFFQLILKAQGVKYLRDIPAEDLKAKLLAYVEEKKKIHVVDTTQAEGEVEKLKDFLFINRYINKELLINLASSLSEILNNHEQTTEEMLKRLITLNELGVFDKIGVGFLISLLPQDQLKDLVYLKIEMVGKDLKPISTEFGTLNYRALYTELTQVQSRLSNRSYDLRLSDADRNMEDLDIDGMGKILQNE